MVKIPTMRCQYCDAKRIVVVVLGVGPVSFSNGASLMDCEDVIPACDRCHKPMTTEQDYQEWLKANDD